jgi:hypothetical protein
MTTHATKKTGTALAALAFGLALARGAAAAPDKTRAPEGKKEYATLLNEVNKLRDINNQIEGMENANKVVEMKGRKATPVPQFLRTDLADGLEAIAPKIVLTRSISEQDADKLAGLLAGAGLGVPGYVTKLADHTERLHECQEQLMPPGAEISLKLAEEVSHCAVSLSEAPAPAALPAPVAQPQSQPVREVQPQLPPPAQNTAPATAQAPASELLSPKVLLVGGSVGGAVLIAAFTSIMRGRARRREEEYLGRKPGVPAAPKPKVDL